MPASFELLQVQHIRACFSLGGGSKTFFFDLGVWGWSALAKISCAGTAQMNNIFGLREGCQRMQILGERSGGLPPSLDILWQHSITQRTRSPGTPTVTSFGWHRSAWKGRWMNRACHICPLPSSSPLAAIPRDLLLIFGKPLPFPCRPSTGFGFNNDLSFFCPTAAYYGTFPERPP